MNQKNLLAFSVSFTALLYLIIILIKLKINTLEKYF